MEFVLADTIITDLSRADTQLEAAVVGLEPPLPCPRRPLSSHVPQIPWCICTDTYSVVYWYLHEFRGVFVPEFRGVSVSIASLLTSRADTKLEPAVVGREPPLSSPRRSLPSHVTQIPWCVCTSIPRHPAPCTLFPAPRHPDTQTPYTQTP